MNRLVWLAVATAFVFTTSAGAQPAKPAPKPQPAAQKSDKKDLTHE